ncbi:hypothetical protein [Kribbella sp. NPDC055071]
MWRTAVGLLAAIGLAAALVFSGVTTNLVSFLLAAFVGGSLCLSIGLARDLPSIDLMHAVPRWAGRGGLIALAILGYAVAVGLGTLALLGLIVASSPWFVARLKPTETLSAPEAVERKVRSPRPRVQKRAATPVVDLPLVRSYRSAVRQTLGELSDEELCLAWRRSFRQLQVATESERRQVMSDVRRAYLDELERRHPEEFAAWIGSGARAAGDPAKFFIHHTT